MVRGLNSTFNTGEFQLNIRGQLILESKQSRLAKPMRWAARVIGTVAAVFFVGMLIASAVSEGVGPMTMESGTLGVLGVIALAGSVTSWWRDITAGTLLVLTSLGLGIHIGLFAGRNHMLAWSMVGLPYLVAAVLLCNSWWLSRKTP